MNRKTIFINFLLAYIFVLFYLAVLNRTPIICSKLPIRLIPFHSYVQPTFNSYKDIVLNIFGFIPVGIVVGVMSEKNRLAKALLAGLFLSLTIECSQLIWKRGTFDVDDLFNNTIGALMGGGIVWFMVKSSRLRVRVLACCKRHSRAED